MPPPHEVAGEAITSRRGQFWVPGERVETAGGTAQRGPMFVHWEAPAAGAQPLPVVLVHGGGGQGTDWTGTPDGRPGWASRLVQAGFATYVVDRCGHGRSPYHPEVIGAMGPQFPYEGAKGLFVPDDPGGAHTGWPFGREIGDPELDQLVAPMGALPADLAESQRMDADRLAELLNRLGESVLVTHSLGGAVGWLAANRRPDRVVGIAAVEPVGPPFAELPGMGTLSWGLTAAELTTEPPAESPREISGRRVPGLTETPVRLFSGGESAFAGFADEMVDFLAAAGARADHVHLPELGINGNGHGLLWEANSDETVKPVIDWIRRVQRS
jgi:pimeloyl-ACP methyl ester carboxylesterase